MHIKMTQTRRGSEDGHTVRQFHAGDIYEVGDSLARDFIRKGWATEVQGEVVPPAPVSLLGQFVEGLARANADFHSIFAPQPTRGSAPQNPATLVAKGEL